jgi:hypothetical protein
MRTKRDALTLLRPSGRSESSSISRHHYACERRRLPGLTGPKAALRVSVAFRPIRDSSSVLRTLDVNQSLLRGARAPQRQLVQRVQVRTEKVVVDQRG